MGTEKPDYVQREDSVPEEIVNERQNIDTPAVASTKAKSGRTNVEADDMSDAADDYEVGGANASHGIFTMTTVEDAVIHMHLIQIALLVHSDRTTVLAQPNVLPNLTSITEHYRSTILRTVISLLKCRRKTMTTQKKCMH